MRLPFNLVEARFRRRLNRFAAEVEVYAFRCRVSPWEVRLLDALPVHLEQPTPHPAGS